MDKSRRDVMKANIKRLIRSSVIILLMAAVIGISASCATSVETTTTPAPPILNSIKVTSGPPVLYPSGTNKSQSVYELSMGVTRQFSATGMYSNGQIADLTSQVDWICANPDKATISETGVVTPVAAGVTAIKASLEGVKSTAVTLKVTSSQPMLTSIKITEPGENLTIGTTHQFAATGTFSDGSTSDITYMVTWTSSNNKIAAISSSTLTSNSGIAIGTGAGTVTVNASWLGITDSTSLTVDPLTGVATQ